MSQTKQKIGWFFFDPSSRKVLLHRRDDKTKESPNTWDLFGGKIEDGEKPIKAFIRELYEELGIPIMESEARLLIDDPVKCVFYIHFPSHKTRAIRLGEGADFAWFLIRDALRLADITAEAYEILDLFRSRAGAR